MEDKKMARKSNTKIVKEAIRSYIKDCVSAELEGRAMTLDDLIKETNIAAIGNNVSPAEIMVNYSLVFTPYTEDEKQLIKAWLDETDAEANKHDCIAINKYFVYLIGRELPIALNVKYKTIYDEKHKRPVKIISKY